MTNWNPRFEAGQAEIDADHREFFAKLSVLKQVIEVGAGRERIVELINLLQRYVLGHFAREESLVRRTNRPAYEVNRAAHREFAHKLEGWLALLSTNGSPMSLLLDVHREAFAWIEKPHGQLRLPAPGLPVAGKGRYANQPALSANLIPHRPVENPPISFPSAPRGSPHFPSYHQYNLTSKYVLRNRYPAP